MERDWVHFLFHTPGLHTAGDNVDGQCCLGHHMPRDNSSRTANRSCCNLLHCCQGKLSNSAKQDVNFQEGLELVEVPRQMENLVMALAQTKASVRKLVQERELPRLALERHVEG